MEPQSFSEAIEQAVARDPRYHPEAYDAVRLGLNAAVEQFRKEEEEDQHVTGQELLEGFRQHLLQEYGPMSSTLLELWGIQSGEDVGNMVYNLIELGYFGRNEGDSLEDFKGGYDFQTAFTEPFLPTSARPSRNS